MIFAASIRFFEGRQPRFTHVPPVVRSSVITEVLPGSCARSAAANAVEPEPRMTRSKCLFGITIVLFGVVSIHHEVLSLKRGAFPQSSHRPDARPRGGARRSSEQRGTSVLYLCFDLRWIACVGGGFDQRVHRSFGVVEGDRGFFFVEIHFNFRDPADARQRLLYCYRANRAMHSRHI